MFDNTHNLPLNQIYRDFVVPDFIHDILIKENIEHKQTKSHKEGLLDHLVTCAHTCEELSQQFGVDSNVAYYTGLLHDIGKPFVKKTLKKGQKEKCIFVGHAQVGSCLISHLLELKIANFENIEEKYKQSILWCIDNHMCCCAHQATDVIISRYINHLFFTLNGDKETNIYTIRLACCLFASDCLSRITDKQVDINEKEKMIENSFRLMQRLIHDYEHFSQHEIVSSLCNQRHISNDKIIIMMYGLSGCGKTTKTNQIINSLNQFKTIHLERDSCLYYVAKNYLNIDVKQHSYLEIYNKVGEANLREQVQQEWINKCIDALEDKSIQVVIIDSVQTLFPKAWTNTIQSLTETARATYASSLKVGCYCFPLHQLGFNTTSKIEKQSLYPLTFDNGLFFPNINFEVGQNDNMSIDFGTGLVDQIINMTTKFLSATRLFKSVSKQCSLIECVHKYGSIDNALLVFPSNLIIRHVDYEDKNIKIESISYEDGLQNFCCETRDYRGECIMFDKKSKTYHLIRGSLPVFPDYASIEKDPCVYPYILDVWDTINTNQSWINMKHTIQQKQAKYALTFKYDGSLFNVTIINEQNIAYQHLFEIFKTHNPAAWLIYSINKGIVVFGSKGRFGLSSTNSVRVRIENAICGSYGSIDTFVNKLDVFFNSLDTQNNVCLHFEAIDKIPSPELTVYYGRAWCPFLGYTMFNNTQKYFNLPNQNTMQFFDPQSPVIWFNTWKDVNEYFSDNYGKLLNGDQYVEPEGCVVHIYDSKDMTKWYPVKLKYDFYYVAHKPNTERNKHASQTLKEDSKYSNLRERLAKFRTKPSISSICNIFIDATPELTELFDKCNILLDDKKRFALFIREEHTQHIITFIQTKLNSYLKKEVNGEINLNHILFSFYPQKITKDEFINKIEKKLAKSF